MGSVVAEHVPAVGLQGEIGKRRVVGKLDGRFDEGGVTASSVDGE
jgi:hypothetical protein